LRLSLECRAALERTCPKLTLPRCSRARLARCGRASRIEPALGWKPERLYYTGIGSFDPRRGLVCHLKPGDRIGEVAAQSIEIILPVLSEVRHRFHNLDVEQPWMKKTGTEPKKDENAMRAAGISR
jgi:hypothetical protein